MNSSEFGNYIVSITPRIYPMVARMLNDDEEAADAMQEILLKLWKNRKTLCKHPNMNGYIFLTARNHCLDEIKRKNKQRVISHGYDLPDRTGSDLSKYEQVEIRMMIEEVIQDLPEKQRDVVQMRDLDGLEFDEIVTLTGITTEHIRVLLSRARKKIASRISEIYSYEKGTA